MNPFKRWFYRPAPLGVYVLVALDKPFGAISETEPATSEGPYIHFKDMSLSRAAMEIPGKSFNWHTLPMWIRERLEMDPWRLVTEWSQMKEWVR